MEEEPKLNVVIGEQEEQVNDDKLIQEQFGNGVGEEVFEPTDDEMPEVVESDDEKQQQGVVGDENVEAIDPRNEIKGQAAK